jgi:hypothetical protein
MDCFAALAMTGRERRPRPGGPDSVACYAFNAGLPWLRHQIAGPLDHACNGDRRRVGMSAVVMCVLNPRLTPVNVGLILLAVLLLGLAYVRITASSDPGEIRMRTITEQGAATQGNGIRGLRGSLQ